MGPVYENHQNIIKFDANKNQDALYIKAGVSFTVDGRSMFQKLPYKSDQKYLKDALLVTVSIPEYQINTRYLLLGSQEARLDLLPEHDIRMIPEIVEKDDAGIRLPWSMLLDRIAIKPDANLNIEVKVDFYYSEHQHGTLQIAPSYNSVNHQIQLSKSTLNDLLVLHWPINAAIKELEMKKTSGFIPRIKNMNSQFKGHLQSFNETFASLKAQATETSCSPSYVESNIAGKYIATPGSGFLNLHPKSFKVHDKDLFHYLTESGIGGFARSTWLLNYCVDFLVTDINGNTFMHNNARKLKNIKSLKKYLWKFKFLNACFIPNDDGKNCLDMLVEQGRDDLTIAAIKDGYYHTEYYSKEDIAARSKRSLPKAKYEAIIANIADVYEKCDLLRDEWNRVENTQCGFRDKYNQYQYSKECESNKELALNTIKRVKKPYCEDANQMKATALKSFGAFEKISYSSKLQKAMNKNRITLSTIRREYPFLNDNLKTMVNKRKNDISKQYKRDSQRNYAELNKSMQQGDKLRSDLANTFQREKQQKQGVSKPQSTSSTTKGNAGYHTPNVHNTDIKKVSCSKLSPIKGTVKVGVIGDTSKSEHRIRLRFLSYDSCDSLDYTPGKKLPIDKKVKSKCSGTLKPGQFIGIHAPKESTDRKKYTVGYERMYTCVTSNRKQFSSATR
jgi:hypothetical protein